MKDKKPAQSKSTKKNEDSLIFGDLTKNPIETSDDLKGGKLALIMAWYMLNELKEQKSFLKIVFKNKGKYNDILKNFESFFGYKPSKEFIELAECFPAYTRYFESISDTWMLEGDISYVGDFIKKDTKVENLINGDGFIFTLLTGLERFGSDPSGDSCFLNTLPHPVDTAEVYGYDHECGELNGYVAFSLADFVSDIWVTSYDFESDEEIDKSTDKVKKVIASFNNGYKAEIKQRPYYDDPKVLFDRAEWIFGHTTGEPSFHFAEKMSGAPDFKKWKKEKNLISKVPVLANYWLLAHFFLGNKNACRECIELAKKTPGKVTPALALLIEKALNASGKEGFKLGKLKKDKLNKIIASTQQNAATELLEPEIQTVMAKVRGEDKIKKLSESQFNKMIQEGVDPVTVIGDYQDDIKTHDLALKELAKKDKDFGKLIEGYFRNREGDAYNEWIYDKKKPDQRLSLPVASAFISGLKFSSDNKKSNAGLTKTLGLFDDDNAINAYNKAFQILNPSDDRLKYIIENIRESSRPDIKDVLKTAAWRFFEILDLAKESEDALKEKRKKEGMTLDNMFEVENNFLIVLHLVLSWNNEESLKLAEAILNKKSQKEHRVFKRLIGDAFRIAGNQKTSKYLDFIEWYVGAVGNIEADGEDTFIDDNILYNFTEASLAYVKLASDKAAQKVRELFDRETISKDLDRCIKSGVLGSLLILNPEDKELLTWLKRLLGNRSNHATIYGAIRAAMEAPFDGTVKADVKQWVKYHIYSDTNSFIPFEEVLHETAWEAIKSLGEDNLPAFDDEDEYCIGLKPEQYANAFLHPEKYRPVYICKAITKGKYCHPEIIKRLQDFLTDLLEYSSDGISIGDDSWQGFKALVLQGPKALPVFAELLKLENIALSDKTAIIYCMRLVESESAIMEWICKSSVAEIIQQLNNPEPRFLPWLDLLAAHAFFFNTTESLKAIENALKARYDLLHGHIIYVDEEPTSVRLPLIFAAFGESSHPVINSLITDLSNEYNRNLILQNSLNVSPPYGSIKPVINEGSKLSLKGDIRGNNGGPEYSITIELDDNHVKLYYEVKNIYFQSMVDKNQMENSGKIQCGSKEKALEFANRIANEYMLMGYKKKK